MRIATQITLSKDSTKFEPIEAKGWKVVAIDINNIDNTITVKYIKKVDGKVVHKQYVTRDEAARGTVEVDESGDVVEGSWIETSPEVLHVTEWEKHLGGVIRGSIIDKLNEIEG